MTMKMQPMKRVGSTLKIVAGLALLPTLAFGQSLTYNSAWGFQSPNELSTNISRLDLEERKKGGFYGSFENVTNYDGNLFATYDCTGSSATNRANEAVTTVTAETSSPSTGSTLNTDAIATGNDQQSTVSKGGQIGADQETSGNVTSNSNPAINNTTGVINAGGGTNTQNSDTRQQNSGTLTASAETGVGCNFFRHPENAEPQVSQ